MERLILKAGFICLLLCFGVTFCFAQNEPAEQLVQNLPPADVQAVISGNIIFDGYKAGSFLIKAYSAEPAIGSPVVAEQTISSPGAFKIGIPMDLSEVYLEVLFLNPDGSTGFPRGLYENNPLRLNSSNIDNVDIIVQDWNQERLPPQVDGETIVISGNVVFDTYLDGEIRIDAAISKGDDFEEITWVDIAGPGKYSLKIPTNAGLVYIKAINIVKRMKSGERAIGYRGMYKRNPLNVGSTNLDNVDIVIEDSLS
jgi:hypothetical protein